MVFTGLAQLRVGLPAPVLNLDLLGIPPPLGLEFEILGSIPFLPEGGGHRF